MATRIAAYLCKKQLGVRTAKDSFENQAEVTEWNDETKILTTKIRKSLLPVGCSPPIENLYATHLKPVDWESIWVTCAPECWYYDDPGGSFLTWTAAKTVEEFGGPVQRPRDFPLITYVNADHCQWHETLLLVFGPTRISDIHGHILSSTTPAAPGKIPGNSASDQQTGAGTTVDVEPQSNDDLVPGMKIVVRHVFANGDFTTNIDADRAYYCTCCLTGGRITSVLEDGEYRVDVNGNEQIAWSSDKISYSVDDWVFLSPIGISPNCSDSSRNEPCTDACPAGVGPLQRTFVILPLKIGQDGA